MSLVVPPYPPPRYTEDEPEVSAWLKRSDEPPDYETYFEGFGALTEMTDDERREWFIRHDNFFV
jgi:hypothetical protein